MLSGTPRTIAPYIHAPTRSRARRKSARLLPLSSLAKEGSQAGRSSDVAPPPPPPPPHTDPTSPRGSTQRGRGCFALKCLDPHARRCPEARQAGRKIRRRGGRCFRCSLLYLWFTLDAVLLLYSTLRPTLPPLRLDRDYTPLPCPPSLRHCPAPHPPDTAVQFSLLSPFVVFGVILSPAAPGRRSGRRTGQT